MNIISVSCGIGKSFEEASKAVVIAKEHKGKRQYNIEVYNGKKLEDNLPKSYKHKIESYLEFASTLTEEQNKMLEDFALHDPITGLLNKTGFFLRLMQLKKIKISQGYYILFDADNMGKWNKIIGYSEVDKRLEIIGREILNNLRHHKERAADILGHRLHESAGDEFLIFFPSKHSNNNLETFIKRTKNIIDSIYKRQMKITKSK